MARMHARRKGKSGSHHPVERKKHPEWSALNPREIESRIIELAKNGHSTSEIGMILRDQYAVPDVKLATGKRVKQIMESNKIKQELPEDLVNLIHTALNLNKHIEAHHEKDYSNIRYLQLTESKIRRLTKYYHEKNIVPKDWNYSLEKAKIMFE